MRICVRSFVKVIALLVLVGVVGCGSGVNEALYQTASAAGRTAVDIFLTELANALADAFDPAAAPPADDDATNGEEADGDEGDGDVPADELIPDPDNGATLYLAGCAACHCDDGSGGCAAGAPSVVGVSFDVLSDYLGNGATHFGQGPLTDQELVDMEANLASP